MTEFRTLCVIIFTQSTLLTQLFNCHPAHLFVLERLYPHRLRPTTKKGLPIQAFVHPASLSLAFHSVAPLGETCLIALSLSWPDKAWR